MLSQIPARHVQVFRAAMLHLAALNLLTYGTIFSGCEIASHGLDAWVQQLTAVFGISLSFSLQWFCEKNEEKLDFLMAEFPDCPHAYRTVQELLNPLIHCCRKNAKGVLPWVWLLVGGFVCRSKSKMNSTMKKKATAVQDGRGATGESFEDCRLLILLLMPVVVLLENLTEMLSTDDSSVISDAEYIVTALKAIGYQVAGFFITDAVEFSSRTVRKRMFFYAIRTLKAIADQAEADYIEQLPRHVTNWLRIDQWRIRDLIGGKAPNSDIEVMATSSAKKCRKIEPKYEDEHFELFNFFEFEWPPAESSFPMMDFSGVSVRVAEIMMLLHMMFKPEVDNAIQFVDANHRLARLVGWQSGRDDLNKNPRDPWKESVSTLTERSVIILRVVENGVCTKHRPLEGAEYMALIGWPDDRLGHLSQKYPSKLLSSFAGLAFNGFQIMASLGAVLVLAGVLKAEAENPVVEDQLCEDANGDEEVQDGSNSTDDDWSDSD